MVKYLRGDNMLDNKCFCEKCNKMQSIKVSSSIESKEFNIGKISYNKLTGNCLICGEEVYSIELSKKNKIEIGKKIKELEDEITILKIIEDSKSGTLRVQQGDEEFLKELENIIHKRNK